MMEQMGQRIAELGMEVIAEEEMSRRRLIMKAVFATDNDRFRRIF